MLYQLHCLPLILYSDSGVNVGRVQSTISLPSSFVIGSKPVSDHSQIRPTFGVNSNPFFEERVDHAKNRGHEVQNINFRREKSYFIAETKSRTELLQNQPWTVHQYFSDSSGSFTQPLSCYCPTKKRACCICGSKMLFKAIVSLLDSVEKSQLQVAVYEFPLLS